MPSRVQAFVRQTRRTHFFTLWAYLKELIEGGAEHTYLSAADDDEAPFESPIYSANEFPRPLIIITPKELRAVRTFIREREQWIAGRAEELKAIDKSTQLRAPMLPTICDDVVAVDVWQNESRASKKVTIDEVLDIAARKGLKAEHQKLSRLKTKGVEMLRQRSVATSESVHLNITNSRGERNRILARRCGVILVKRTPEIEIMGASGQRKQRCDTDWSEPLMTIGSRAYFKLD